VRAGAGVNTIDVAAASARGIYVANCPGKNAIAVAELTMGLILSLDRRLVDATVDLRAGRWEKSKYSVAQGLFGRRIGVAGLGSIGREVLQRARSFGLEPCAWSRSLTPPRAARMDVVYARTLEELASFADVLTIHLPLMPQTRGAIGRSVLEALPDGAIVVNTARSEVMDYGALAELIPRKGLRVGLDVFAGEPDKGSAPFDAQLLGHGIVYGTPHIGASTEQAQRAIALETARIIRSFMTEENVPNVVNICATSPARYAVVIRMLDKVGVLANTLSVLKRHGINIEEISNTVFEGATATCTKMRVSGRPSEVCLKEIAAFEEVLHVDSVALPNLA
jgi:D-3-phosphoglycerate dehydrogenase